jgi:hypothetical protein
LSHSQRIPLKYLWLFLPIVAAGGPDVQSYEDGIFAEHRGEKAERAAIFIASWMTFDVNYF